MSGDVSPLRVYLKDEFANVYFTESILSNQLIIELKVCILKAKKGESYE